MNAQDQSVASSVDPTDITRRFHMSKLLAAAAFSALALVGLAGAAQAECYWAGNHWNCPDRAIYPKSYPWGTAVIDGKYQRPMMAPQSDINYPAAAPPMQR
jgi:hypothetical protein